MTLNKLDSVLESFSIHSEIIFNGDFCGGKTFGVKNAKNGGHLHYLRSGTLTVLHDAGHKMVFEQPSIIFLPYSTTHRIITEDQQTAELICAEIQFTALEQQKVVSGLPSIIFHELNGDALTDTVTWLFKEVGSVGLGQKSIVSKLCDILLIQLFRKLTEEGWIIQGMLAGLSHPQLASTLIKLQEAPESDWTLALMAEHAAMSRSKFADLFRATIGQTPNDFLTDLRISMAQQLLSQDKPVGFIANKVGYEDGSVLARVFRKKTGMSPKEWQKQQHAAHLN
ncbi:helix-turn-helix transcriptional regulator [Marinomonas flavescens]|uniref:helix-turn-helix transcriptional regulator n=1 Tax=Marinomonas flavescens TaxID=2529379 RepID=UPI001F0A27D0|nr:AraC family transcriptional regulator [Marinomonas flavescens]